MISHADIVMYTNKDMRDPKRSYDLFLSLLVVRSFLLEYVKRHRR